MMLEEVIYSGEWWLPSNPEKRTKGKLSFNQTEGAILALESGFSEPPKVILGISSQVGQKITLQDCIPLSWEFPGVPYKVFASRVFLGSHFNQISDTKFKSLHCQFSNFFEWLWKYGIEVQGNEAKEFTLAYKRPESISIPITPKLKISIDFTNSVEHRHTNGEVEIKQYANVSFYPSQKKNMDEYLKLMQHFRNLLCLATQVSIFPQDITGRIDGETLASSIVQILYKLDSPPNIEANVFDSLFTFKDIESKFESSIQNWFRKYNVLEPVCQLYFGSLYGRFVYLNLKFLCLVQALEAYHCRITTNQEMALEEYNQRIYTILGAVPREYRKWLRNELIYSNEPSLRKRLKDIYKTFSLTLDSLNTNKKSFINKVVNTRNYLTHYDVDLERKSAKNTELFVITEKLRIIVEMCLMKEIGFSLKEINHLICKHYQKRLKVYEK
jgi:hypothetical protein